MKTALKKILVTVMAALFAAVGADAAYGDVQINGTNFPDEIFREYVLVNFDNDGNGKLSESEINACKKMDLFKCSISDLKGIEYFTALTYLNCNFNYLTSLNVSQNTALTDLKCGGNEFTSLNVSENTDLNTLFCWGNQLTSLEVGKNTALEILKCECNQLTSLDLSNNKRLFYLDCTHNPLEKPILCEDQEINMLYY